MAWKCLTTTTDGPVLGCAERFRCARGPLDIIIRELTSVSDSAGVESLSSLRTGVSIGDDPGYPGYGCQFETIDIHCRRMRAIQLRLVLHVKRNVIG